MIHTVVYKDSNHSYLRAELMGSGMNWFISNQIGSKTLERVDIEDLSEQITPLSVARFLCEKSNMEFVTIV